MKMKPVITPDVLNILCEDPEISVPQPVYSAPEPQPEPQPKRSFWGKLCGFFRKAVEVVTPVLNIINTVAGAINAFVRFKYAFRGRAEPRYTW